MDKASALKEIARIPVIRSAKDLGVMMPEPRFEITDKAVFRIVEEHKWAECLQFFRSSAEARAAPHVRVLIIAGHHDERMIDYLDYLGKEGVLTDRVILLYKCGHFVNSDLFENLKKQYNNDMHIRLGDRPIARNLQTLYEQGHKGFPEDLVLFDKYDVWLIPHSIGLIRMEGRAKVKTLGYEALYDNAQKVYTTELLPQSKFIRKAGATFENQVDYTVEGLAQVPDLAKVVLEKMNVLSGDARFSFSSSLKMIGRISFSVMTPVVQTIGIGSSHCQWQFEADEKPLLGDQIMLQTVLVPRYTDKIDLKVRGYALIKAGWTRAPVRYETQWLNLQCLLIK